MSGNAQLEAIVQERIEQEKFRSDCEAVAKTGGEQFPDFQERLSDLWLAADGLDNRGNLTEGAVGVIQAAMETGQPDAVLHYLGTHQEEAAKLAGLPPARQGAAVGKLSATLQKEAAVKAEAARPKAVDPLEWYRERDAEVSAKKGHTAASASEDDGAYRAPITAADAAKMSVGEYCAARDREERVRRGR